VPGARERLEQRCDRRGQDIEHAPEGTLRPVLRFRAPGSTLSAAALAARALALSEVRAAGRVRAGALAYASDGPWGERIRDPEARVAPGTALRLDAEPPTAREGEGTWQALVPALPWREGRAEGFAYATLEERGGLARVRLDLAGAPLAAARAWFAAAGAPVLGDVAHGGILVAGGLRLQPASAEDLAWPDEAVFPPGAPAPEGVLRISAATARVLARGHPWVIADRETERGDRFAPGTLVALRSGDGRSHGLARSEGAGDLAARLWSAPPRKRSAQRGPASPWLAGAERSPGVEARVARALERREPLISGNETDAYRLLHGEADGLPGLAVDRFGPLLRMLVTGRAALPLRERVAAALLAAKLPGLSPDPPVVEVLHLRERPAGALVSVRLVSGAPDAIPEPLIVREGRLRFRVESGLAEPTRPRPGVGFFLDQRDNRARLAARARGGRFLNLFAHTGGFSAALLAGGAERVVSVDLSGPYLAELEENLRRSGLPLERHQSVRREARRFLAELAPGERFDGVVIDPPTAAASGRRFWSVRRDLEPLASEAFGRLAPSGFLLLTRQDRAGRGRLERLLAAAAASAGVGLAAVEDCPQGADFPAVTGFPEGAPFEARLVIRS
jgi:23S rRNA (cytosine1962-C5)-methyltransferase